MNQAALPGFEGACAASEDIVMTPDGVAAAVVRHFQPSGVVLDPCRGDGAFWKCMVGASWCEIREGRDFFAWRDPVDWCVSNPPYSIFSAFHRHAQQVAANIVWLIPINKAWNSERMIRETLEWGGIVETLLVGGGAALGFPVGFAIGAVHYQRGYRGAMRTTVMEPA